MNVKYMTRLFISYTELYRWKQMFSSARHCSSSLIKCIIQIMSSCLTHFTGSDLWAGTRIAASPSSLALPMTSRSLSDRPMQPQLRYLSRVHPPTVTGCSEDKRRKGRGHLAKVQKKRQLPLEIGSWWKWERRRRLGGKLTTECCCGCYVVYLTGLYALRLVRADQRTFRWLTLTG